MIIRYLFFISLFFLMSCSNTPTKNLILLQKSKITKREIASLSRSCQFYLKGILGRHKIDHQEIFSYYKLYRESFPDIKSMDLLYSDPELAEIVKPSNPNQIFAFLFHTSNLEIKGFKDIEDAFQMSNIVSLKKMMNLVKGYSSKQIISYKKREKFITNMFFMTHGNPYNLWNKTTRFKGILKRMIMHLTFTNLTQKKFTTAFEKLGWSKRLSFFKKYENFKDNHTLIRRIARWSLGIPLMIIGTPKAQGLFLDYKILTKKFETDFLEYGWKTSFDLNWPDLKKILAPSLKDQGMLKTMNSASLKEYFYGVSSVAVSIYFYYSLIDILNEDADYKYLSNNIILDDESFSLLLANMKTTKEKNEGYSTTQEEFDDYVESYLNWKKEKPERFRKAFRAIFLKNQKYDKKKANEK